MKTLPKLLIGLIASALTTSAFAIPLLTLPTGPVDGIPPNQFNDATVYSLALLKQQQSLGLLPGNTSVFDFSTGSGNLGEIIYSKNGVANDPGWETPMYAPGSTFSGTWGTNSPGTVGLLRQMLTVGSTKWQPLFVFDHNENTQNPNLFIRGSVSILHNGSAVHTFTLDDGAGGFILSCGHVDLGPSTPMNPPCSVTTPSANTYSWDTNGSGKADYIGLFAGLDLYSTDYADGDAIQVHMELADQDGGFEELSIGGYQFSQPIRDVPEPGSLALFAGSLLMLGAVARRRSAKK